MGTCPKPVQDMNTPRRKGWTPVLRYRLLTGAIYKQIADDIGYNAKYVERRIRACEEKYCALADEFY